MSSAAARFSPSCTLTQHVIPASHPRLSSTVFTPETRLFLAVDEYIIESTNARQDGLTLVLAHGTGFNKKLWQPTITRLLRLDAEQYVRRILALDACNHGDSWALNSSRLTNESHWADQSCDILAVMKHFRVEQPALGIGHSFGGGIIAHAAMMEPSAFKATVFLDPILFRMEEQDKMTAARALRRRDRWESLEAVTRGFRENKGFADWHPEVLALHAEYSTTDLGQNSSSERTLTTPKAQEAATYLAGPFPELPELLAQSRQWHFFLLGGKSIVIRQKDRDWIQSISQSPNRVFIMKDAGHLIPMQDPGGTARNLRDIIEEVCLGSATPAARSSRAAL